MAASSLIRGAWYRPDQEQLELLLWSGQRYLYSKVPRLVADEFIAAASKGAYYNRRIRNCFPCRNVTERRWAGAR